ncbi:hypothetical protein J6590_052693 [Homalodisca vitripennis]|nr:hypothetical protein J6590_052693 [Homalodisca vitripennis]
MNIDNQPRKRGAVVLTLTLGKGRPAAKKPIISARRPLGVFRPNLAALSLTQVEVSNITTPPTLILRRQPDRCGSDSDQPALVSCSRYAAPSTVLPSIHKQHTVYRSTRDVTGGIVKIKRPYQRQLLC